jgi:NAD-dependent DNA ligase
MSGVFKGLHFAVSGNFNCSQAEMKQKLTVNGGFVESGVNKKVNYLICNQLGSEKTSKAQNVGATIVSDNWVDDSIKAGKVLKDKKYIVGDDMNDNNNNNNNDDDDGDDDDAKKSTTKRKSTDTKADKTNKKSKGDNDSKKSSVFEGITFCVSGAFEISQNEMKQLLNNNGGTIASSVNKQVTYVIANDIGSSKTSKAEKMGLNVVTEEWVKDSVEKGKLSTNSEYFLAGEGAEGDEGKQ